jgi:hypothetical protein
MTPAQDLAAAEAEFAKLAALKKRSRSQSARAMQLGDRISQLRLMVSLTERR